MAGIGAVALVLGLNFGSLLVVSLRAEGASALGPSDYAAIRFTVSQALTSAAISTLLAIPIAKALARRNFFGRKVMLTLLGAPFILPVIVAVLGLLAIFGRSGLLSRGLGEFGFGPLNIYGFHGVVLAHVFFNLPLATRLILQGWQAVPVEHFRLIAQLDLPPRQIFRLIELPLLRAILPGAFATIFLLSSASFAVALALGGGPKATTVELAIYQAFRFDFDLSKAALLAMVQFGISGIAAVLAWVLARPSGFGSGFDRLPQRWDGGDRLAKITDAVMLTLAALFLFMPLAMVAIKGAPSLLSLPPQVLPATFRSLTVALGSAALALALGLAIASWIIKLEHRKTSAAALVEATGYLSIAASPMVIGTGIFILIFPLLDPITLALPITALVNAAISLPFALRVLIPAIREVESTFAPLAASLNMTGFARFKLVVWPRIKRPAGFATGLAAALSMGDLGVIALFADPNGATLPLVLYRLMAAYQMDAANGVALLLLMLSLGLFYIFDRGGRMHAAH